ncbi:hypothetical protein R1sor_023506 [Riccia sorocarpa]|uniref:Uncharacterized protein n=1 Tax=Riccia sorocarpa TaxID=122646 RepID=A0ABD3GMU9_9MARC
MNALPTNALSLAAIAMPDDKTPDAEHIPNVGAENDAQLLEGADEETERAALENPKSSGSGLAVASNSSQDGDKASLGLRQAMGMAKARGYQSS